MDTCLDLSLYFQITWCLTALFCSCALRDMQWSTVLNRLWLDHRNAPTQTRPGSIQKLPLLHYCATVSAQGEDLYSARHNSCLVQRSMENCVCPSYPQLPLEISTLSYSPDDLSASYPLKFPYSPPFGEKVFLEHELSFLNSFINKSFCCAILNLVSFEWHLQLQAKDPLRGHWPFGDW